MPSLVIRLVAPWALQAFADLRRRQQQRNELRLLDPGTCRDLGVDRSELSSFEAEAVGLADRTRQRVRVVDASPQKKRHTPAHTVAA
jgi:uncharacterized protein YjiS (DUF1127 family)